MDVSHHSPAANECWGCGGESQVSPTVPWPYVCCGEPWRIQPSSIKRVLLQTRVVVENIQRSATSNSVSANYFPPLTPWVQDFSIWPIWRSASMVHHTSQMWWKHTVSSGNWVDVADRNYFPQHSYDALLRWSRPLWFPAGTSWLEQAANPNRTLDWLIDVFIISRDKLKTHLSEMYFQSKIILYYTIIQL